MFGGEMADTFKQIRAKQEAQVMSEKKIVVPEGMLQAAKTGVRNSDGDAFLSALEVALRWLSENPIVPTDEQLKELCEDWGRQVGKPEDIPRNPMISLLKVGSVEWQRRMFLAQEPKVTEEIGDLMWADAGSAELHNKECQEAFRRGQRSR